MARYIDADALLEELQEELDFESLLYTKEQNEWFNKGLKCAIRDVKHLPTADVVEVRHGRWEDRDGKTWCSLCQASNKQYKPPYCPHCGAKMDKGVMV